jgi:hypothetical protein
LNGRINRLAGSKGVPNQEDSRKTKELENINKLLNQKVRQTKIFFFAIIFLLASSFETPTFKLHASQ